jgi:Flp pilus assembly protein TadB
MANQPGSLNDQILANRQQTWNGIGRLLFWGTIYALILALITTLHVINGPSIGLSIFSVIGIIGGFIAVVVAVSRK